MNDEFPVPDGYRKLKCPKCKNVWYSRAKREWVTCPNCVRKFNTEPKKKKRIKKVSKKKKTETVSKKQEEIKPKYVLTRVDVDG